jgi:Right handed beta helix region
MTRIVTWVVIVTGIGLGILLALRSSTGQQPKEKPALPFGLTGDGKADETEKLQKAVDGGAGSIQLPKGTYRITKTIVVDLDKTGFTAFSSDGTARIVMAGPGPAIRFVGTHGGTAAPASVKAEVWDRQRTPMVDGLEIVGDHAEADGIAAEGTMQLTVSRTVIRQCRHGIHLLKRNRNVLISACHIYQNRGIGIYYDHVNLHQSNIVGCHISYCDGGGVVVRGGEVRNVHIGTCDIESCMSADGPATANVLFDSTGGSLAEAAITGCTIQHNDKGKDSANIRIVGQGDDLRKKEKGAQWGHITIGDNVFSDVQHNIDIDNARGVTITGNTFWMAYQYNLRIKNSQQIVVGPNVFERNPGYNYGTSLNCKNAILFQDCQDCTLTGLHVHNIYKMDAAFTVENCKRFNMTNCSILDCEGVGLFWKNVTNSRLSDCMIVSDLPRNKSQVSLRVVGGKGNQIVDNMLSERYEIDKESGVATGNSASR